MNKKLQKSRVIAWLRIGSKEVTPEDPSMVDQILEKELSNEKSI
jgi:hypothetical protein